MEFIHVAVTSEILTPAFCSAPRSSLPHSALSKAAIEKAFICLPEELIDVVFRRYVEHVHAQLPVIDISELSQALEPDQERGKRPSVLLWQALTAAVIPFFTDSELGKAGLVTANAALETFVCRAEVLIEMGYEECRTTELQAVLLLYWRLSPNTLTWGAHQIIFDRAAQYTKEIEPRKPDSKFSRLNRPTALQVRLWWSYYLTQLGPTLGCLDGTAEFSAPRGIRVPTLNDFEFHWLSSPRALQWYRLTGPHQALSRHLQLAQFFCSKAATSTQLGRLGHVLNTGSTEKTGALTPARSRPLFDTALPVSQLFWTAMDIESILQALVKNGCGLRKLPSGRDEQSLELGFFVHTADFSILHQCIMLSLLWAERLFIMSQTEHHCVPPGMAVAADLIKHTIEQTAWALTRSLDAVSFHRLPLLAHNTNPNIMETTKLAMQMLESAPGSDEHDAIYRECGRHIRRSLWRYENHIALHSSSIDFGSSSPGADCLQELDQSGSSSNSSTPASAPAESDPPTPLDTQHIEWGRMKAHWESFGGELLHFVDYVRLL